MFDIINNDIWFNGRIWAIIVAQGRAAGGWSEAAREMLLATGSGEYDLLPVISKAIGNHVPKEPWGLPDIATLPSLPEGADYTQAEIDAAKALAWHIRPELKQQFNVLLNAHMRRQRLEFADALKTIYNEIEEATTE